MQDLKKQRPVFVFPSEHGAYIMLLAAWVWGTILSPAEDIVGCLLVLALAIAMFLAQESIRRMVRGQVKGLHPITIVLLVLAAVTLTALVILHPSILILTVPALLLGALYFQFARKGPYVRSMIGFTLLALITPATMLAGGVTNYVMIVLSWIAVALFATSSVLVVGIRLDQHHAMLRSAIFHLLYALLTVVVLLMGEFPAFVGMASLAIVRYVAVVIEGISYKSLPIKTIGLLESLLTCASLILTAYTV